MHTHKHMHLHTQEMHFKLTFFSIEKKSSPGKLYFHNSAIAYIKLVHPLYLFKSSIFITQLCLMFNQKSITCLIRSQVAVKRVISREKNLQISLFCLILTTKVCMFDWLDNKFIQIHSMSTQSLIELKQHPFSVLDYGLDEFRVMSIPSTGFTHRFYQYENLNITLLKILHAAVQNWPVGGHIFEKLNSLSISRAFKNFSLTITQERKLNSMECIFVSDHVTYFSFFLSFPGFFYKNPNFPEILTIFQMP